MQPEEIIKLIGLKRIIILSSLLAIIAVLGAGWFFGLAPMLQDKQRELSSVKSAISSVRGKITNIKRDIKYLEENTPKYKALLDKGIFNDQDRFETERLIEYLKVHSGGLDFSYNIGDVKDLKNSNAARVKHALVSRAIKLTNVDSELDYNIYGFFQKIREILPLFIKIKSFSIKRKNSKLTQKELDEITDANTFEDKSKKKDKSKDKKGENNKKGDKEAVEKTIKKAKIFPLASADIEFDWITLSKKHFKKDSGRRGRRR